MRSLAGARRRAAAPLVSGLVGSVTSVRSSGGEFVLTYDDGPTPAETEGVLESLAAFAATATFFVLVNRARRQPGLLREMQAAGHEVALHGLDHRRLTDLTPREVHRRTRAAKSELEDLCGAEIRWFRPPYGHQRLPSWFAVRLCGLEPVLWSAGLLDWLHASHEERLDYAMSGIGPGAIVLGHDGFAGLDDGVDDGPEPRVDRRALTRDVLGRCSDLGLRSVSLETAVRGGTVVRHPWFRG